ncbi:MAG: AMP-binding protein [Candidatus Acidoferrales bacterium]|nr:AMP-binding protein [Candidatus Acidoferrales bacterium]
MSATGTKFERAASVEAQTLATVRQLLVELGGSRGLEELVARGAAAHLERELGLGSLERVELMVRLGNVCGVRLPDRVVAEADTVQDLADALLGENLGESSNAGSLSSGAEAPEKGKLDMSELKLRPPKLRDFEAHAAPAQIADLEQKIRGAESLTEILRLRGLGEPTRAHIHLYEEDEQLHTITFGELYGRASAVARELRQRGLEQGQTVAIMLPTCAEFFYTFAGILLAGGIPVPIYPPFRADRIAEYATRQANILRNAETRFLITFRQAEGLARLLQPRVPTLREVLNAERLASVPAQPRPTSTEWRPVENLSHHARGEDIAFLQYTSGSTGDPKGVTLTHANLLANIRSIAAGVELKPEDVAVSWLPLYHDMGLIGAWFVPLFSGNPLVVMSPLAFLSRPERWLWAIHRHRGTISPAPNFAYELCVRKIADKELEGLDLSSWRAAFNGAEPVHADTLERFAARFAKYGFRREALLPVYGLAEATLGVSAAKSGGYKVDRIERAAFESEGRAIPAAPDDAAALEFVSAGEPFPDVEVRIVGNDGYDAGDRCEGRLWFRSPAATSGYYRNPTATLELMREPGWLDSGDLAYRAGGELYITGRAKDLIIKAGRNLYPHEIEDVAGRVAGVRTGCVVAFGAPDARNGTERLVVAAEVRNPAEARRISAEITRAVDEAMGMPPDLIELVPPHSIPKTSSGKLRRNETRRLFLEGKLGKKVAPPWLQIAKLAVRTAAPRAGALVKRGAKAAIDFLYGIYALIVFAVAFIPLWLAVGVTRDRKRAARLMHVATRGMLFAAGIPVRVEGGGQLAGAAGSGPWIFAPNHSSYVDILVTVAFLPPDVRFVVKGEVLAMPFFGMMARRSGQLAFDRSDPQARIQQTAEVNAALGRGESVAIYPEGTFTSSVGIRPFQLGAFKAAVDSRRPICPVAVRGARRILRDHTYLPRPGRVTVTFGPPIAPDPAAGDDWREIVRLRDATREIIARNSGEPML